MNSRMPVRHVVLRFVMFGIALVVGVLFLFGNENASLSRFDLSHYREHRIWYILWEGSAFGIVDWCLSMFAMGAVVWLCDRKFRGHHVTQILIWSLALLPFVVTIPVLEYREHLLFDPRVGMAHVPQSGWLFHKFWVLGPDLRQWFQLFETGLRAARFNLLLIALAGMTSIFSSRLDSLPERRHPWNRLVTILLAFTVIIGCIVGGFFARGDVLDFSLNDAICLLSIVFAAIATARMARIVLLRSDVAAYDAYVHAYATLLIAFSISAVLSEATAVAHTLRDWVAAYTSSESGIDFLAHIELAAMYEREAQSHGALLLLYAGCPLVLLLAPGVFRLVLRGVREPQSRLLFALTIGPLVLASLLVCRVNADFSALMTPFSVAKQAVETHGIQLPDGRGTLEHYNAWPSSALVRADGTVVELPISPGRYSAGNLYLYNGDVPEVFVGADRRAPFEVVLRNLKKSFPTMNPLLVGFTASPDKSPRQRPNSSLLGLVGSDLPAYQVLLQEHLDSPLSQKLQMNDPGASTLVVLPDNDEARIIVVEHERPSVPLFAYRIALVSEPTGNFDAWMKAEDELLEPLRARSCSVGRGANNMVVFAPKLGTPIGEVFAMVDRFPLRREYFVLTTDRSVLEESLADAPVP